jgi:small subunit ribosomal protein S6
MNRYEILLLTVPQITGDETSSLEKELERLVKGVQGKLLSFERWGKYRLAFPVNKNDYGVYFLSRFESDANISAMLEQVRTLVAVKFNDVIMRNIVTRLSDNGPIEYNRPESLEEAPSRDASGPSFFKDRDRDRDRDRDNRPSRPSRMQIIEEDDEEGSVIVEREEESNMLDQKEA